MDAFCYILLLEHDISKHTCYYIMILVLLLQIFLGLQKLLGKSFPVGVDNLTWTLLKPIRSEGLDIDLPDIEALTEVYSKLNIALGVMHECFEPVKEPHTRRDVVEDVIFCRG